MAEKALYCKILTNVGHNDLFLFCKTADHMLLNVQLLPSFFSVNCIENGGGSSGLKTEWRWGLRDGMMMPENGGEEIPQRNAKKHLRVYKTYQVFWRNLRWNFTKWYGRAVAKVFSWLLGWGWAGGGNQVGIPSATVFLCFVIVYSGFSPLQPNTSSQDLK